MANSFEFRNHTTTVEIEGKEYVVDYADARMVDRINRVQDELASVDYDALKDDVGAYEDLCRRLHEMNCAVLGDDECNALFEGRGTSVIDELGLLAFLADTILEVAPEAELDELTKVLDGYGPDAVLG